MAGNQFLSSNLLVVLSKVFWLNEIGSGLLSSNNHFLIILCCVLTVPVKQYFSALSKFLCLLVIIITD